MDEPMSRQPTSAKDTRRVPREVRIATGLLLALGAVLILNGVIALAFRDDITRSAQEDMAIVVPEPQLSALLTVASAVLLLLGALHVLAGVFVRRGRQWARVVAFVAAGVLIVFAGVGALTGVGVLAVVLLGAGVGVVSLLMQSSASLWFAPPPTALPMASPPPPGAWS